MSWRCPGLGFQQTNITMAKTGSCAGGQRTGGPKRAPGAAPGISHSTPRRQCPPQGWPGSRSRCPCLAWRPSHRSDWCHLRMGWLPCELRMLRVDMRCIAARCCLLTNLFRRRAVLAVHIVRRTPDTPRSAEYRLHSKQSPRHAEKRFGKRVSHRNECALASGSHRWIGCAAIWHRQRQR